MSSPTNSDPPQERRRSSGSEPRKTSFSGRLRSLSITYADYDRVVVLALDSSDCAKRAFDYYLEQVHKPHDLLVLTHCPEAPSLPTFSFKSGIAPPVAEWKKILDDMNERVRKLEEDYEGTCIAKKLKYKVRGDSTRNAGDEIVRIAEEERADLLVVGSRGQSKVKRALLGSVSEYVVRHSNVPVLVVPNKPISHRLRNDSLPE